MTGSGWSMWPLAPLLDIIGATWVLYGGWVTVSALLPHRPRDFARLSSRVVFGGISTVDVSYEFDEPETWKHVQESVNARVGTRFLILGAVGAILGRVLAQGGALDAPWLAAGLIIVLASVGLAEWYRRRQAPRLVNQSFLAWLESLTPDPAQPVMMGKMPGPNVFDLAWQQRINALTIIVQRDIGDLHGIPDRALEEGAARTLGRECGWKPDKLAWRAWLRG